jgi:hypothetical protein
MNPFVVARLFKFYRKSGIRFVPALKRALETARIGF